MKKTFILLAGLFFCIFISDFAYAIDFELSAKAGGSNLKEHGISEGNKAIFGLNGKAKYVKGNAEIIGSATYWMMGEACDDDPEMVYQNMGAAFEFRYNKKFDSLTIYPLIAIGANYVNRKEAVYAEDWKKLWRFETSAGAGIKYDFRNEKSIFLQAALKPSWPICTNGGDVHSGLGYVVEGGFLYKRLIVGFTYDLTRMKNNGENLDIKAIAGNIGWAF